MEENVNPELSLNPEPEQSQDHMESCSQEEQKQQKDVPEISENAANEMLEESEKYSKSKSEVKKTWGFRRSTVAKREMPSEATPDNSESRCPVRRSGRQPKRTDKLEEFLSSAKRGPRKSILPSLESGDPPSQTPTDAETASEASFDGNADTKGADDGVESPERRTRSSTRKQAQRKTRSCRQTRGSRRMVKDDENSENEEDGGEDADEKPQLQNKDEEKKREKNDRSHEDVGSRNSAKPPPEQDSEKKEGAEEKKESGDKNIKVEMEKESDEESEDKPSAIMVKRGPIRTYVNKKRAANKNTNPVKASAPANKGLTSVKMDTKLKAPLAAGKTCTPQIEDENEDESDSSESTSSSSVESDDGGYDPNALYCICRQKHNKRFMICCDRCEEWFHGDCVGITEARGRLMERNGEDYICPNCTIKKNQVVRPATTILSAGGGKLRADVAAVAVSAAKSSAETTNSGPAAIQSATAPPSSTATVTDEKGGDDQGIKGRIEKATNPTGKKKIKIFQPQALQQTAEPKTGQKAAATVEKTATAAEQKVITNVVASTVEVMTTPAVEQKPKVEEMNVQKAEDSLPKCIGPGCENNAQPDSVYCGNDCILRHAAAAMKSITDVKEPKQKEKSKSTSKRSSAGGKKTTKKSREEEADDDEDSDEDYNPDLDDDDEDEHAEEHPPPPATASWSSDHNYIAVTPEKTTPISPTVLNKKSPPKEEKQSGKEQKEKEPAPAPQKLSPMSTAPVKANKTSPTTRGAKAKAKKPPPPAPSLKVSKTKVSKKPLTPSSKTAAKSKKPPQKPKLPFPSGPIHVTGALRVTKSNFTIPKKQPQQKDTPSQSHSSSSSSSRVPSSPVSSAPSSHSFSSSRHSHPAASPPPVSMPPPNNQMRQNIRRSLTDILYKRVSDSDDLKMTENEVGRLAVAIEKEMFNLCLNTDSKYKNKYRTLMFNLKDPKNKGLFYRVVGGEVSPFRLVRLSAEELLSKEISEWKKPDAPEAHSLGARAHSAQSKLGHRQDSGGLHNVDVDEAPPTSDADVCISAATSARMASSADQDESSSAPSVSAQPFAVDGNSGSGMLDIFSTMLKDTTSEHKTHLFDLNCKICTGQRSEDEPAAKKAKLTKKVETKPPRQELHSSRSGDVPPVSQQQVPTAYQQQDPLASQHPSCQSSMEPNVPESQPHLYLEDPNVLAPPAQTPAPVTPTVSSVTITRRDPRMARHSSGVTVTHSAPEKPTTTPSEPQLAPAAAPPAAPVEVGQKGPLPMPPAAPPSLTVAKPAKTSTTEPPPEGETAIFLHSQEKIWKGFINMQSVAKFVTKAYLVSGSFEHLKEDLPDTIHIGGRISPNTVWDYVGKLKTSLSKELCLIRFHPATEEEEVAYVSLFSYFSSRKRFGVVANNNRRIKDLYLIPLSSKDPLPSKLLPFDGPGLEPARPNLLLGLLICQKDRKRAGAPLESEEKRYKSQTKDADEIGLPKPSPSVKAEKSIRQSLEIPFSTTPPGSPPSLGSSENSSSAVTTSSVLSLLSSVKAPATSTLTGKDSPSSTTSVASSAPGSTPLQTILNTLFGKKKHESEASNSPSDQGGEVSVPAAMLDPIVQQFGQISKEKQVDEDEDDRPYDPEEEYDPSMGYNLPQKSVDVISKPEVSKQAEEKGGEVDDVAYDPEDDSIFDDVKPVVPSQAKAAAECLTDAQKILQNLKQVGDQKFQKQEEEVNEQMPSTATVTETLITQPTKSLLVSNQLLQLGKKVEELVKSSSATPLINQKRDPRQSRDPRQAAASKKEPDEPEKKADSPATLTDSTPPSEPVVQELQLPSVAEPTDPSEKLEMPPPEEDMKSETLPFMESDKAEVSIPLLGEEIEPDMEYNYMGEQEEKSEEAEPAEAETEMDKFSIWPNAASILKAGEDSEYEESSKDKVSANYFSEPSSTSTVTSTIPVLTQSTAMGDSSRQYGPPPATYPPYQNQWAGSQQQQPPPGPPPQNVMPLRGPPPPFPLMGQRGPPPQMFELSLRPQHIGQQGPLPGLPPPPSFEGQNSLPPQRFAGPPPPFNFPGSRGPPPPPPFTGLPPGHFDNRLPPPSHFPGPRGPPPSQYGDRGSQPPMGDQPRGPPEQYNKDIASSLKLNVDQHQSQNPLHIYKDKQGPPPGPAYRGPPPNQFEDRRAPPLSGDFRSHNQYGGSRVNCSPPHQGSFDEHRGPPQENRGPPSQHFGGSERYRFDRHSDEMRPVRHSGPLLPTPSEGPIVPPARIGGHSPDLHREDNWRRHSPDMRRRSNNTREGSEPRGDRFSRFDGGHRETGPVSSQLSEDRQREMSEDRRRDMSVDHRREMSEDRRREMPEDRRREMSEDRRREMSEDRRREMPEDRRREMPEDRRREKEREIPHASRASWDRGQGKRWSRERELDRGRERERDKERSRERDRSKGREGERHREPEGERHRDQDTDKRRDRDRDRDKDRDRGRDRDSDRKDHDRDRGRNRGGERDRERDRDRDRERDRRRDRSRSRERDRDRGKDRGRDRDREREKDRDRDRDRRERSRSREKREEKRESKHDTPKESDKTTEKDKNTS
ncbi:hypothetical protein LDENG_00058040 [Lucifuga dentata]|nr:hypothetical protein LDENG_00058040 [Lucifuga dentata]